MRLNPRRFVKHLLLAAGLGWALLLPALRTAALPDDRLQAIEITAERAVRDERAGYTVYIGDVILEQGSLHIEADRLTIYHDREAADRIVAIGQPATMRQQPELDKGFVTASARRIVYEKSRELVVLREAASIEQEGAVVTGESIQYFMAEQRVRADAAKDENARVQVIIPAEVVAAESGGDDERGGDPAPDAAASNDAEASPDAEPTTGDETSPPPSSIEANQPSPEADPDNGRS